VVSQGAPRVSTTPVTNFATNTAGVLDTSGEFGTGVNNTGKKLAAWWKIIGTISDCFDIKVNLKEKKLIYSTYIW
jgi:hypothetical protein